MKTRETLPNALPIGVCYYPEAWPRNYWETDLDTMLDCGISFIRIAEFTWTLFQPEENKYDFCLFDDFLSLCEKKGMNVIFCTPTAIPPIWMTEKYPDILNTDQNGNKYYPGFRHHCNYSSENYWSFSSKIVEELARHYGSRKIIIGWQIDNEFNCENNVYYSDCDHKAFRNFVKEKYVTVERLNDAWGAPFWNQYYSDWSEIYLPRQTVVGITNPHLLLEEKEFISWQIRRFCKMQADILKKHLHPDCFITHNGIFDHLDNHQMTKESLDFISYDSYPGFAFQTGANVEASILGDDSASDETGLADRKWSKNLSAARSVSKHFIVTEQQANAGGSFGRFFLTTPKKGQIRLWTFQSIAHGADLVSFFRWRTTPVGQEMYWHGFFNYNQTPTPKLEELKKITADVAKINEIAGSNYLAQIAFVRNYQSDWDSETDNIHGPVGRFNENNWIAQLQYHHMPFDYLYLTDNSSLKDLLEYKVLIVARMAIITEQIADLLEQYVRSGGTLIIMPRTCYKDLHGRCNMLDAPSYLTSLTGSMVKDFSLIATSDTDYQMELNKTIKVPLYYETLTMLSDTAVPIAKYVANDIKGEAAITRRTVEKGCVYHVGASLSMDGVECMLKYLPVKDAASSAVKLSKDIEIVLRSKNEKTYIVLLNYTAKPQPYQILTPLTDMFSNCLAEGDMTLEKYGVHVYVKEGSI